MTGPIGKWLAEAAVAMKAECEKEATGPTFRVLGELNHKLYSRLDFCNSSEERCSAYFLSLFIDDIFNNFAGDFPYNKNVVEEKKLFLYHLSEALEILSKEDSNIEGAGWNALSQLVESYFTQLEKIDKTFSQGRNKL